MIHTVGGQEPPVAFSFPENSKHNLAMTIDEGETRLQGTLEVYGNNFYTRLAPMWVDLDEYTCNRLRGRGGYAQIAIVVPSQAYQHSDKIVHSVEITDNPVAVAGKIGTIVAVLSLKKIETNN